MVAGSSRKSKAAQFLSTWTDLGMHRLSQWHPTRPPYMSYPTALRNGRTAGVVPLRCIIRR